MFHVFAVLNDADDADDATDASHLTAPLDKRKFIIVNISIGLFAIPTTSPTPLVT